MSSRNMGLDLALRVPGKVHAKNCTLGKVNQIFHGNFGMNLCFPEPLKGRRPAAGFSAWSGDGRPSVRASCREQTLVRGQFARRQSHAKPPRCAR